MSIEEGTPPTEFVDERRVLTIDCPFKVVKSYGQPPILAKKKPEEVAVITVFGSSRM